jgi:hypothetical protein
MKNKIVKINFSGLSSSFFYRLLIFNVPFGYRVRLEDSALNLVWFALPKGGNKKLMQAMC